MHTQEPNSIKPSFFDDDSIEGYVLWKTNAGPLKLSTTEKKKGILLKKSAGKNLWKPYCFTLYEDRLAQQKEELQGDHKTYVEKKFCMIQNMRVERIEALKEEINEEDVRRKSNESTSESCNENVTEPAINPENLEKISTVASIQAPEKEKERIYGFKLTFNGQGCEFYAKSKIECEEWLKELSNFCILAKYSENYNNLQLIGNGSFARVYLAKKVGDNQEFAVKTFAKDLLTQTQKAKPSLINEINIMRKLKHQNIIELHEIYESDHHIYLVLELLKGGELFDRIMKNGQYSEKDASLLMKKLLDALAFMHKNGTMHRDIKPENLILKYELNDHEVKIADFGLATIIIEDELLFKRCGTPGYVAPEVLADKKYDGKVDVFSAGVILYILLTGSSPFFSNSYNEILMKNLNCEINFNFSQIGQRISEPAVDLMKKMLAKDPRNRITAEEASNHPWVIYGDVFRSPQSGREILLSRAQEGMKKVQQDHALFVKMRAEQKKQLQQQAEETGLRIDTEWAAHAPSPLITGRIDQVMVNNGQFNFQSPEMNRATLESRMRMGQVGQIQPINAPPIMPSPSNRQMWTQEMKRFNQQMKPSTSTATATATTSASTQPKPHPMPQTQAVDNSRKQPGPSGAPIDTKTQNLSKYQNFRSPNVSQRSSMGGQMTQPFFTPAQQQYSQTPRVGPSQHLSYPSPNTFLAQFTQPPPQLMNQMQPVSPFHGGGMSGNSPANLSQREEHKSNTNAVPKDKKKVQNVKKTLLSFK